MAVTHAEPVEAALEIEHVDSHLHPEGSFDIAEHPVPTGREEIWRFTPLRRLRGLHADAPLDGGGSRLKFEAPEGVRAEVDHSDDSMQKKIRTHTKAKVPFQLIVGEEDASASTVSFRFRDGSQRNGVTVDEAIERIVASIESHELVETAWLD